MRHSVVSGLAVAGCSATILLPSSSAIALLGPLAAVIGIGGLADSKEKTLALLVTLAGIGGLVSGWLSPTSCAAVLVGVTAVLRRVSAQSRSVMAVVAALNLSNLAAATALLETNLPVPWASLAIGPMVAVGLTSVLLRRIAVGALLAGLIVPAVAALGTTAGWTPAVVQTASAAPVVALHFITASVGETRRRFGPGLVIALFVWAFGFWALNPPRHAEDVFVLRPAGDAEVAHLFRATAAILDFAGQPARAVSDLEAIPPGSAVVIPDTSGRSLASATVDRLRLLTQSRGWTVVAFGEHSNLGGCRDSLMAFDSSIALRDDISVPPGNGDLVGNLWGSAALPFPRLAALNRGATVVLNSLSARVLLSGEGWHADDPGEELAGRLGDYVEEPKERRGRLVLAAARTLGSGRWVLVGDNSPVVDELLIAEPRGLLWVLAASSLFPTFLLDLVWSALLAALWIGWSRKGRLRAARGIACSAAVLFGFAAISLHRSTAASPRWQAALNGELPFDDDGFARALVEWVASSGALPAIFRHTGELDGSVVMSVGGPSVHFGLVAGSARVGPASLSRCRRLGSLSLESDVRIADAQACALDGEAEVLLGSRDEAVAFSVAAPGGRALVVLDRLFLSGVHGREENLAWLLSQLRRDAARSP